MKLTAKMILACLICGMLGGVLFAQSIDECGRLSEFKGCLLFNSFLSSKSYILDNYGQFGAFDIVRVSGEVMPCSTSCGQYTVLDCVQDNTIDVCEEEDLGCGVLHGYSYDPSCWLWTSPLYGEMEITQPKGFASGDTVKAFGIVSFRIVSFCMMGDGAIIYPTFSSCDSSSTDIDVLSWGIIKAMYSK